MRVNLRDVRRSDLDEALAAAPDGSVSTALAFLARRALLLQEAQRSGLGAGLPTEPTARARAFLERVISKRVICGNITDRDRAQMYRTMKPRFVHGDLYRVAELRWHCEEDGIPEAARCRDAAATWAEERWRPILDAVTDAQELSSLGLSSRAPRALRYVEFTFHVGPNGKISIPAAVVRSVKGMVPGDAQVLLSASGARLQVLLDHRPPIHRTMDDPSVRAEVQNELCPRLVSRNRTSYVETLVSGAAIDIKRALLPSGHDVPARAMGLR